MRISEVDERGVEGEAHCPVFLVYEFDAPSVDADTFSTSVFEITGADVSQVLSWVSTRRYLMWAVALKVERNGRTEAHWIEGCDANSVPRSDVEVAQMQRMRARARPAGP